MKIALGLLFFVASWSTYAQEMKTDEIDSIKKEPLYSSALLIIDGKKVEHDAKNKYLNINELVNPLDIESIEVLKDKSALVYGEEGKNGVILITTRNNHQPLYVVDGEKIPIRNNYLYNNLDPEEIISVEVLKGDNAYKAYGKSGKNGVVLITTKKSNKSMQR